MASLTISGIPESLLERLKDSAAEHHRSLEVEVVRRLEDSMDDAAPDPEGFLTRVEALQRRVPLPPLTDEMLTQARSEGRP